MFEDIDKGVAKMFIHRTVRNIHTYVEFHVSTGNMIQGEIKIRYRLLPFFPRDTRGYARDFSQWLHFKRFLWYLLPSCCKISGSFSLCILPRIYPRNKNVPFRANLWFETQIRLKRIVPNEGAWPSVNRRRIWQIRKFDLVNSLVAIPDFLSWIFLSIPSRCVPSF